MSAISQVILGFLFLSIFYIIIQETVIEGRIMKSCEKYSQFIVNDEFVYECKLQNQTSQAKNN